MKQKIPITNQTQHTQRDEDEVGKILKNERTHINSPLLGSNNKCKSNEIEHEYDNKQQCRRHLNQREVILKSLSGLRGFFSK